MKLHHQWTGTVSGYEHPETALIADEPTWQAVWRNTHHLQVPTPATPAVDFQRHVVAAVFVGQKPSGGYGVRFESLVPERGDVTLGYRVTEPAPGALVAQMLTAPFALAQLDRPTGQVRFQKL